MNELRESLPRGGGRSEEERWAADDKYAADPRDTASPRAFVALLEKIVRGQAVDRAASDAMLALMKRCQTGRQRIRWPAAGRRRVRAQDGIDGRIAVRRPRPLSAQQ